MAAQHPETPGARAPRLYWRDSGLLHALAGVETVDDLLHQPWVGASWEGFVIQHVTGVLAAIGKPVDACFFRTSDGYEIDLVFKLGTQVWAVDARLSSWPSPGDFDRLSRAADLAGADRRYLVARVREPALSSHGGVLGLRDLMDLLQREKRGAATGGG